MARELAGSLCRETCRKGRSEIFIRNKHLNVTYAPPVFNKSSTAANDETVMIQVVNRMKRYFALCCHMSIRDLRVIRCTERMKPAV